MAGREQAETFPSFPPFPSFPFSLHLISPEGSPDTLGCTSVHLTVAATSLNLPIRRRGEGMSVQARLREEHKRRYMDLDSKVWYQVIPVFPGVTQRMVNMAGERLARLATPRGFMTIRADHLEFRSADVEAKTQKA
jgi:hypothetical protein